MKRELTEEEEKMTKKGIKKLQKEIDEATESLEYNIMQQKYQLAVWKYEDAQAEWKNYSDPVKRKKVVENYEKAEKEANLIIESSKKTIEQMNNQLKSGVEIKKPSGVN